MAMSDLVNESAKRRALMEATVLHAKIPKEEEASAIEFIHKNPDFTSYHLLFALKSQSESLFEAIPARVRAEVLCSALANLVYLNDWGHLAVAPKEGPAMNALIATGHEALRCLKQLLADRRPAPFFGSADATVATQYRHADFAYHAASSILGENSILAPSLEERDRDIATLVERIR